MGRIILENQLFAFVNIRLTNLILGTSFIVNGREYSAGFRISTQGNLGKCVEPCLRSIDDKSVVEDLRSTANQYFFFCV